MPSASMGLLPEIEWDGYGEFGSAPGPIANFNRAAVRLHDPITDGETKTDAFADGLGGEERFKDPLAYSGCDTLAVVCDEDCERGIATLGPDLDRAPLLDRVD